MIIGHVVSQGTNTPKKIFHGKELVLAKLCLSSCSRVVLLCLVMLCCVLCLQGSCLKSSKILMDHGITN